MTTTNTAGQDAFAKVIAKAWADDGFKRRLIEDPRTVLTEAGAPPVGDMEVRVVENTATVAYLVLPAAPDEGEISEEALSQVSGGTGGCVCLSCL